MSFSNRMKSKKLNNNYSKQQKWATYGLHVTTREQCENILNSLKNLTDIEGYKKYISVGCNEISKILTNVNHNNKNSKNNTISAIVMVKNCPEVMVKYLLDAILLKETKIPIIILPNDSVKYLSQLLKIKRVSCFCLKRYNDDYYNNDDNDNNDIEKDIEKDMKIKVYPPRLGLWRNKVIISSTSKRTIQDVYLENEIENENENENEGQTTNTNTTTSKKMKMVKRTERNMNKNIEEMNKDSELTARLDGLEELLNELFNLKR